jgi:membrane-associated phospholipid phosphatase
VISWLALINAGALAPSPRKRPRGLENPGPSLAQIFEVSRQEKSSLARWLFRLRPEEAIALLFIVPTAVLTISANRQATQYGLLGARFPGGLVRIAVAVVLLAGLALALRLRPGSRVVRGVREVLPFLTCILIYTNLHDTIGLVNPHDVHHHLIAIDQWMFGVQPCVWAERLITPLRTEVMQFFYVSFAWIAPSTALVLLMQGRVREFRAALMGVLVCFYLGYVLYVAFPAAPPRLVLAHEFTKNLRGYPMFTSMSDSAFALLPLDSRAAFPSLHAGASSTALLFAWRFERRWFAVLLPFSIGLWLSTIYLRHHYVVDLLAGFVLAPIAVWLAPRLDAAWARRQRALGVEPAVGAPLAPEVP